MTRWETPAPGHLQTVRILLDGDRPVMRVVRQVTRSGGVRYRVEEALRSGGGIIWLALTGARRRSTGHRPLRLFETAASAAEEAERWYEANRRAA